MKISLVYFFGKEGSPLTDDMRIRIIEFERMVLNSSFKFDPIWDTWSFWIGPMPAKDFKFEIKVERAKIGGFIAILILNIFIEYIRND